MPPVFFVFFEYYNKNSIKKIDVFLFIFCEFINFLGFFNLFLVLYDLICGESLRFFIMLVSQLNS
jgi:hypothetical protein